METPRAEQICYNPYMTQAQRQEQKIEAIIERKLLEFLGDPDEGLKLRPSFVAELKKRLKSKQKYVSHAEVKRRYGIR